MHNGAFKLKKTLAVIFHNWGPYHLARLQKASEEILIKGIEISANSHDYKWNSVNGYHENLNRITLFNNIDSRKFSNTIILNTLSEHLNKYKPECVAIPGWSASYALSALWWCVSNNIPAICMGDSTVCDSNRVWWKEQQKKNIIKRFSSALTAGTASKQYFHQLGMSYDQIFQGYNAVDNEYFKTKSEQFRAKEKELRDELNLKQRFFLVVSRFIPAKNLFRLIEAYAKYCKLDFNTWDLVILGDGELMPQIKELIYKMNLGKHVFLPGFKQYDELPKFYALAECLFLPSQKDTWGLVVNEAMASGLPVIVSNRCGCAQDLVIDGENGFKFNPFDVKDICEKMVQISNGECDLKKMGQRSREIIENWGCDNFAKNLLAAAEYAMENPAKPSLISKLLIRALIYK